MSETIFALTLEYVNHYGSTVKHYLPTFSSMQECEWWRDWFLRMLEHNHARVLSAVCEQI